MSLRWTDGWTFTSDLRIEKLRLRGQPDVGVVMAEGLSPELVAEGARLEIRSYPSSRSPRGFVEHLMDVLGDKPQDIRLFVWQDERSLASTETLPSIERAKQRAEEIVMQMEQRLVRQQGRKGYRVTRSRSRH